MKMPSQSSVTFFPTRVLCDRSDSYASPSASAAHSTSGPVLRTALHARPAPDFMNAADQTGDRRRTFSPAHQAIAARLRTTCAHILVIAPASSPPSHRERMPGSTDARRRTSAAVTSSAARISGLFPPARSVDDLRPTVPAVPVCLMASGDRASVPHSRGRLRTLSILLYNVDRCG